MRWIWVTTVALAACFGPDYVVGLPCSDSDSCPVGQRCDQGICVLLGATEGPSCAGLSATCGASGTESCCASAAIPGGTYNRSYDEAPDDYNDASWPATVSDFRIDTYEITVGRFRKFVEAGRGTRADPPVDGSGAHAAIAGSGWSASWNPALEANPAALIAAVKCSSPSWTDSPGANETKPMNCITWYEAMAFCSWDGGYLPTEAEWNYTATGGSEQRAYPWSSPASSTTIDATYAVYLGSDGLADVGSKSPRGDGRWGQVDLAGNVLEWVLDWSGDYPEPCNDCANLAAANLRVLRGGAASNTAIYMRSAHRFGDFPANRSSGVGARCARRPQATASAIATDIRADHKSAITVAPEHGSW